MHKAQVQGVESTQGIEVIMLRELLNPAALLILL